ncbi:Pyrroline-5-carboxylate reductase [Plasmopara halstedii]|uniref:Pyrroline-5-carboxylate reductase n=1 Tax=Plasmopara halstedii TaxID=4781 RepID=A0A0P1A6P2_PLAHL|nr:Pyrroline-5-carboxylate reductase [Plasmopara halstedii]CEG36276.1 Pyrroline-5-carboxylate reductase [Plasmopara halstedii]|eukprot:XP_024572645.1 Pyrroline-5-carboxylate reductase [Plasmopara halstedii]
MTSPSSLPTSLSCPTSPSSVPSKKLLASTRLASKTQLLYHTRSIAIQVIAHEVYLLVLACTKCYAEIKKSPPQVGICGGGTVGATIVMTLLTNGYSSDRIAVSTRQPDRIPRCDALKSSLDMAMYQSVSRYYNNARLARESDVLILCMPPSHLKTLTIQIRHALAAHEPLVISVLCGVTHQSLVKTCSSQIVVRVQPDVRKIASQWQEGNSSVEKSVRSLVQPLVLNRFDDDQNLVKQNRQQLIRLAAEAIVSERDDVRILLRAFRLFCHRIWRQDVEIEKLGHILFGDRSESVLIALKHLEIDINGEQKNHEEVKILSEAYNWLDSWNQDMNELQEQLAAHALSDPS